MAICKARSVALLALTSILIACAPFPVKTGADFNEKADFSAYESFAWLSDDAMPVIPDSQPISSLTVHRLKPHPDDAEVLVANLAIRG